MEPESKSPIVDPMKNNLSESPTNSNNSYSKNDQDTNLGQSTHYNKDFMCVFCKKKFTTKKYLRSHIKTIHESSRIFLCPLCGKQLAREKGLQQHLRTIHEGKWSVYCNLCGKGFINQCRLKKHTRSVHERERRLNCTLCGKAFQNENARRYHMISEHSASPAATLRTSEEDVNFPGESDSQTSESSRSPPTPASSSQPVMMIPVPQPQSQPQLQPETPLIRESNSDNGTTLASLFNCLNRNMSTTLVVGDHLHVQCIFCQVSFDNIQKLIVHIVITHNDTFNNGFCCQSCGKRFPDRLSLRQHKSAFHKVSGPRYQCSHCNKTFATKEYQKLHEATVHEGTKCFSCTTCGKNFSVQQALRKHIIIQHEGGKPYRCSTCKMCFRSRANMTQHRSQAHNIPMTSSGGPSQATSIANKLLIKYNQFQNSRGNFLPTSHHHFRLP